MGAPGEFAPPTPAPGPELGGGDASALAMGGPLYYLLTRVRAGYITFQK